MKKNIYHLLLSALIISMPLIIKAQVSLTKKWETEATLKVPESVIYNPEEKMLYVSNINGDPTEKDGNGFISKLNLNGKIEKLDWINGLDAPKGMGIFKRKLYVSDITKIVIINLTTSKIEQTIEIPGSAFLNDITIDKKGTVYISDSQVNKIYTLDGNEAKVWLEGSAYKGINGLLALENKLRFIDNSNFYEVSYLDKKVTLTTKGIPAGDGIVEIGKDEFIISSWVGEVSYVKADKCIKLFETKEQKINSADIWYVTDEKLLLVPTFFANSIVAYTVKNN